MFRIKCLGFLLILNLVNGCSIPMSASDFESEAKRISATKSFKVGSKSQILYKGSDEDYHYFYISPNFGIPRAVKVDKSDLILGEEFPYSDDSSKWLNYDDVN